MTEHIIPKHIFDKISKNGESILGPFRWHTGGPVSRTTVHVKNERQAKWDRRFLEMAQLVASWSKDPSTKVGAVIVRGDRSVASVGFNGFPRGMHDDEELYLDRDTKLSRVVHAEMNAILSAPGPVRGHTLYLVPFMPCDRCAVHIIQAGITRVVAQAATPEQIERWGASLERTRQMFREARVSLEEIEI